MKRIVFLVFIITLIFGCTRNFTGPEDIEIPDSTKEYWKEPSLNATVLYFRLYDSMHLDSVKAGEIQYRLDVARTVNDTLLEFSVKKDWVLGDLLLFVNEELYSNFDTTTCLFSYQPLDSLFNEYQLKSGIKNRVYFKLKFPTNLNIPVFANIVNQVEGVTAAEPNQYGGVGICDKNIKLEIHDNLFKFFFIISGACGYQSWEVHVVDDKAELVPI